MITQSHQCSSSEARRRAPSSCPSEGTQRQRASKTNENQVKELSIGQLTCPSPGEGGRSELAHKTGRENQGLGYLLCPNSTNKQLGKIYIIKVNPIAIHAQEVFQILPYPKTP